MDVWMDVWTRGDYHHRHRQPTRTQTQPTLQRLAHANGHRLHLPRRQLPPKPLPPTATAHAPPCRRRRGRRRRRLLLQGNKCVHAVGGGRERLGGEEEVVRPPAVAAAGAVVGLGEEIESLFRSLGWVD